MLFTPLFIPAHSGFANRLLQLSYFLEKYPDGLVHESILDYGVGEWFDIQFETTSETQSEIMIHPPIFLNSIIFDKYHKHISKYIQPNEKLKTELNKYIQLLDGVRIGLHVRRGLLSTDCLPEETSEFANDDIIRKFKDIAEANKNYANDLANTNKEFNERITNQKNEKINHTPDLVSKRSLN